MQPDKVKLCGKLYVAFGILIIAFTSIFYNFIDVFSVFFEANFEDWQFQIGPFKFTEPPFGLLYLIPIFYFIIAAVNIMVGIGLYYFKKWARTLAIGLAVLYLFAPVIGTIFGVYVLYQLIDSQWFEKRDESINEFSSEQ